MPVVLTPLSLFAGAEVGFSILSELLQNSEVIPLLDHKHIPEMIAL